MRKSMIAAMAAMVLTNGASADSSIAAKYIPQLELELAGDNSGAYLKILNTIGAKKSHEKDIVFTRNLTIYDIEPAFELANGVGKPSGEYFDPRLAEQIIGRMNRDVFSKIKTQADFEKMRKKYYSEFGSSALKQVGVVQSKSKMYAKQFQSALVGMTMFQGTDYYGEKDLEKHEFFTVAACQASVDEMVVQNGVFACRSAITAIAKYSKNISLFTWATTRQYWLNRLFDPNNMDPDVKKYIEQIKSDPELVKTFAAETQSLQKEIVELEIN